MAYYQLEPFGEVQSEYRAALIAAHVTNTARDTDAHPAPYEPTDFMRPTYLGEPQEDDEAAQRRLLAKAQMIFGAMGARKE